MTKIYYFICGLPRSGSTLLSSILNQNPNIHAAGMSTSLQLLYSDIQFNKLNDSITTTEEQAERLYKNSISGYYESIDKPYIFDVNRKWSRFIGILPRIFPYTKLIFCVRDIPSILNSFENHYLFKNIAPTYVSDEGAADPYVRLEDYYKSMIKQPYEYIDYIFHSAELKKSCIFIDYDELIQKPKEILDNLYCNLNIPNFIHNFNNVENSLDNIDNAVNNENLHKVYEKLGETPTKWILPQHVIEYYSKPCFWKE